MARFRKRPVVIEAMQYDGSKSSFDRIYEWANPTLSVAKAPITCEDTGEQERLYIDTLEGKFRADVGDWIIRGVKGEFYPCKPDIFEATYEPAGHSPSCAGMDTVAHECACGWLQQEATHGYIAKLEAALAERTREVEELTRKGKSLCLQNGNLLVEAHDLKREIAQARKLPQDWELIGAEDWKPGVLRLTLRKLDQSGGGTARQVYVRIDGEERGERSEPAEVPAAFLAVLREASSLELTILLDQVRHHDEGPVVEAILHPYAEAIRSEIERRDVGAPHGRVPGGRE